MPVVIELNDSLVSLKAAESGEGIALGWHPLIDRAVTEGRLVQILPDVLRTGRNHYILTVANAQRWVAKQFCDWLLGQDGRTA